MQSPLQPQTQYQNVQQQPVVQSPAINVDPRTGNTVANLTANEGYATTQGLATSNQSPSFHSNPFMQDAMSYSTYSSISDPGKKELQDRLVAESRMISKIAESNFLRESQGETPESITARMFMDGEHEQMAKPLFIRRAAIVRPSASSSTGFVQVGNSDHFGVRAVLTNKRILLVDATEDAILKLTEPKDTPREFLQRKMFGVFSLNHKIMHDLWYRALTLKSITGVEFHFSHYSESARTVKRFHHGFGFFLIIAGCFAALFGFVADAIEVMLITAAICIIIGSLIMHYMSNFKSLSIQSMVGKSREINIGYYDTIHNSAMVLNLMLEDAQQMSEAVEWVRNLQSTAPRISSDSDPLLLV
jgi:hypothetical protein